MTTDPAPGSLVRLGKICGRRVALVLSSPTDRYDDTEFDFTGRPCVRLLLAQDHVGPSRQCQVPRHFIEEVLQ